MTTAIVYQTHVEKLIAALHSWRLLLEGKGVELQPHDWFNPQGFVMVGSNRVPFHGVRPAFERSLQYVEALDGSFKLGQQWQTIDFNLPRVRTAQSATVEGAIGMLKAFKLPELKPSIPCRVYALQDDRALADGSRPVGRINPEPTTLHREIVAVLHMIQQEQASALLMLQVLGYSVGLVEEAGFANFQALFERAWRDKNSHPASG